MRICNLSRSHNLILRNILHTKGNIVVNRIVKENSLLGNNAHKRDKTGEAAIPYIIAIHKNSSTVYIIKARNKVCHSGFSSSRWAHHRHHLALWNSKIYMAQDLPVGIIREADIFKLNRLIKTFKLLWMLRLFNGVLRIQNIKEPIAGDQSSLNAGIGACNCLCRLQHPPVKAYIDHKCRHIQPQFAVNLQPPSVKEHCSSNGDAKEFRERRGKLLTREHTPAALLMRIVCFLKILIYKLLRIKCLNYPYSRYGLLKMAHYSSHKRLRLHRAPLEFSAYVANYHSREGESEKGDKGKSWRHIEESGEEAYNKQRLPEEHVKAVCHSILHLCHIRRDGGEDVSLLFGVEIAHVKRTYLVEEVSSYILHYIGSHINQNALRPISCKV